MKISRASVESKASCLAEIRYETSEQLTSYAGLVLFGALFQALDLRRRLRACFEHLCSSDIAYRPARTFLLLVLHLLLGFRRVEGMKYYRHDPLIGRLIGWKSLPHANTLRNWLKRTDPKTVMGLRKLTTDLVCERLSAENLSHLTLDFDGTVQSTTAKVEGTAIGYNRVKKGARSYYPLFCTVAQTAQFFDVHHRPGNVHDSNGATTFMLACVDPAKQACPKATLEARMDSPFFAKARLEALDKAGVIFTCSLPVGRLPALKTAAEKDFGFRTLGKGFEAKEVPYCPDSWKNGHPFRVIVVRQLRSKPLKGPLQLDLFEPVHRHFEYSAIITNDPDESLAHLWNIVTRHHGRGAQERLFGEAKQNAALGLVATRLKLSNQLFAIASMFAVNLTRELQIRAAPTRVSKPGGLKRRPCWKFQELGTLRQRWLHRAGRLISPQGRLTLVVSADASVQKEFDQLYRGARLAA